MTIKLDFRTKLFMTIVLSYVMVLGNIQVKYFLQALIISVIPIVLLINTKHTRVAIIGMATLVFVYGADRFLMKLEYSPLVAILLILVMVVKKILPAFLMGKYTILTSNVGESIYSLKKMKCPDEIAIPLTVMVRFFYAARIDYSQIKKAMRLSDMYPLYWTASKEGIFMRYSHEYKLECIELYRQGIWAETPKGIKTTNFRHMIREWSRIEEQNGADSLKHLGNNKVWSPEMKYELVARVLAGQSNKSVAISVGISHGLLYTWVRKYKELGYNGLVNKQKGRKSNKTDMKKKTIKPKPLSESEREELIRLRAEVETMKAEIEVVKKRIALRQERWAAQLKAKKQRLSKNSERKDTN